MFPAEAYAEKEGTLVHPDGRLQRLRPAIGRPGGVRPGWQVLAEIARRLGLDLRVPTGSAATAQLLAAVPFYAGVTLDALAGRGLRWPELPAAAALPGAAAGPFALEDPPSAPAPNGALRLGTFRPLWAAPEVAAAPALAFLTGAQQAELAPADAERLGVQAGDRVEVSFEGATVRARAELKAAVPAGSVFLADGIGPDAANALTNGEPRLVEVRRA